MTSRGMALVALAGVVALGLGACKLDPYKTGDRGHWLDAAPPPDAVVADADTDADACVVTTEVCDGYDNDCNGIVDDASNLDRDAANCGECGRACLFDNALATCEASQCAMGECQSGYYDINEDPADGCEYRCQETNGGVEACDGRDNDCNGFPDDGFDLTSDPNNCGSCRNTCVFLNGVGACVDSLCELGSCKGGFRDVDGEVSTGCECQIQMSEDASGLTPCVQGVDTCPPGEECADPDRDGTSHCLAIPLDLCDGRDNDCDGTVDEDATAMVPSDVCYSYPSGCTEGSPGDFACNGPCTPGTMLCQGGVLRCVGQTGPAVETCNDIDDDCNGTVDDGWDKLSDPNNCGGCGVACTPLVPNAVPQCVSGQCEILACLPGFWNIDPNVPGCEYACTLSNGGVEKCGDGLDNDCDGQTDEGFDLTSDPQNCGDCGYSCSVHRPRGAQPTTSGQVCVSSVCHYECVVDNWDINGDLALGESGDGCEYYCEPTNSGVEICDGFDNDCDRQVDEGFNLQVDPVNCGTCGRVCEDIKPPHSVSNGCASGKCQYSCEAGYVDINADLTLPGSNGCECHIEPEQCDGVDNDCNGVVDDPSAAGCTTYYKDQDLDTYGVTGNTVCLCAPNPNQSYTATRGTDCNDLNPVINPAATEVCDGRDNDCDGNIDNATPSQASPLISRSCYTGQTGTDANPPCHTGLQYCDPALGIFSSTCVGQVTPVQEICDTVDNDCDGTPDDGFDLMTDMQHCGACNTPCAIPHAVAQCAGGLCVVDTCIPPWYDYDANPADCEYYCEIVGAPACDGAADLNCNGIVDSNEFDKQTDPFNCGACGTVCAVLAPFGTEMDTTAGTGCTAGSCVFRCATGFVNVDGLPLLAGSNGCECVTTNGGVEVCDNEDNDCDGLVDDGIDKDNDPLNCGACDYRCADLGDASALATHHVVSGGCSGGDCLFSCQTGYYDMNGDLMSGRPFGSLPGQSNGCEYHCEPAAPGVDVCDGQDNDCDGYTDRTSEGLPLSQPCYDGPVGTQDVGVCKGGVETCVSGAYGACIGQVLPQAAPICGASLDYNCNGIVDGNEFTLATDPYNCGTCGNNCYALAPPNMIPSPAGACSGGICQFVCVSGYRDLAGGLVDGCEYACPVNPPKPSGYETCNGLDDDCDGQVDEEPDLTNNKPSPLTQCSYPRVAIPSGCDGVQVVCGNGPGGAYPMGWYCDWTASALAFNPANPPVIEFDPNRPNVVLSQESRCDEQDNDCDGAVDEPFVQKGMECDDGDLGACVGTGNYQCKADFTGVECVISDQGATPSAEVCDGLDNDCDGLTDESKATPGTDPSYVIDDLVEVATATGIVYVYRYEASRPDATQADPGVMTHRACSADGVVPWANVSHAEAKAACEAAGFRLCGHDEWQTTCEGGFGTTFEYPYMWMPAYTGYDPLVCNGNDYDYNCTGLDDDDVLPTGMVYTDCMTGPSDCVSQDGVFDLSGNLMEWTGSLAPGKTDIYRVRGGSFLTHEWGLACQSSFVTLNQTFRYDDLGFRCCSSTAP